MLNNVCWRDGRIHGSRKATIDLSSMHAAHQFKSVAVKLTANTVLAQANAKVVPMPLQSFHVWKVRKLIHRSKVDDDVF